MVAGGVATALWDGLVYQQILRAKSAWKNRNRRPEPEGDAPNSTGLGDTAARNSAREPGVEMLRMRKPDAGALPQQQTNTQASEGREGLSQDHVVRIRVGIMIVVSSLCPLSPYLSPEPKFHYPLWPLISSQICTSPAL